MNHPTPILYATTTASGGLTVGALVQWLATADGKAFLAFLGSSIFTAIGSAIALRTQAAQAAVERERLRREAAVEQERSAREARREQEWRDAIQEFRLARLHFAGPPPPGPPLALPAP